MRIIQSSSLMSSRINLRSSSYFKNSSAEEGSTSRKSASIDLMNITKKYEASAETKNVYSDIKDSAAKLVSTSEKLTSDDKKNVNTEIESFVNKYNALVKNMNESGNKLYSNFSTDLKNEIITQKKELSELGIDYKHDATLSLNKKQLEKASPETLKKLFTSKDGFASKISSKAAYIEKRALIDGIVSGTNFTKRTYTQIRNSRI